MPAAAIAAEADTINEMARSLWPQWAGVGSFVRDDRERLSDPRILKARRWFAVSIAAALFSPVVMLVPGVLGGALVVISTLAYMVLMAALVARGIASRIGSRCPRCRGETHRMVEALPHHHWYCPRCNVEWDDETEKAIKSGATWQF